MALLSGLIRQTLLTAQFSPLSLGAAQLAGQGHWYDEGLCLFYVCEGSLFFGQEKTAPLKAGQLALGGPRQFCQAESEGCLVLWLRLEVTEAQIRFPTAFARPFRPLPAAGQSTAPLTALLAKALRLAGEAGSGTPLARQALALQLLESAAAVFGYEAAGQSIASAEKAEQIAGELAYCAQNFAQPLTLSGAAARCYLSVPYFSKLFRLAVGQSYLEHLTDLRLSAACALLEQGGLPLHRIAEQCGFASARALSESYRQRYGCLPSRRKVAAVPTVDLAPYLNQLESGLGGAARLMRLQPPPLPCNGPSAPLPRPWQKTLAGGPAASLFSPETLAALRTAQRLVGFNELLLDGLLAEEMGVLCPGTPPVYNFSRVDQLLDEVVCLGLVPALRLQPPAALAKPAALPRWQALLAALLQHLARRYTPAALARWRFAPPPFAEARGLARLDDFFAFYRASWQAVKALRPAPTFCSPCLAPGTLHEADPWFAAFLGRCREFGCLPDGICVAFPPAKESAQGSESEPLASFLQRGLASLGRMGLGYKQLSVEGYAPYPALTGQPIFATLLAKSLLDCGPQLGSLCLPGLTPAPGSPLLEGSGLFAASGVASPALHAVSLLARLGPRQLAAGDGYLLTARADGFCLLLYNHIAPGAQGFERQFHLVLEGLPPGLFSRIDRVVSADCCALELWRHMGCPAPLTGEEQEQLAALARPALRRTEQAAPTGRLVIEETLKAHTLQLIELWPEP